jgi:chromosome segregation ATPase
MPAVQRAAERTPLDVKLQREIALLTERLGEMQRRLARKEEEHQGDADFIGKLLAEVADRDRKLKEARAASADATRVERLHAELTELDASYADVVADLETAQDRLRAAQDEMRRLRLELESERTARTSAERALETLHASLQKAHAELSARGVPKESLRPASPKTSKHDAAAFARVDLGWLLEVLATVKDETRVAANRAQRMLEDARRAFDRLRRQDDPLRGAADAHAGIVATMRHATAVQDGLDELDAAAARATQAAAVASDDATDADALHRARVVVMQLWRLRDALAPLVPPDVDDDGNELAPPPHPAPRRMRSRMPPAR